MDLATKWRAWQAERETRLNQTFEAFRSVQEKQDISAMPIVISYTATIGRVEYDRRGGEPVFTFTTEREDDRTVHQVEEVPENVYAIRDEFLRIKKPEQAPEFLRKTGRFSPLSNTITWSEFEKWRRFAFLVQEHEQLASAMKEAQLNGECAEVLKALNGDSIFHSSFFDVPDTGAGAEFDAHKRKHPEIVAGIQKGKRIQEDRRRELWAWFRHPPGSIEWIPNSMRAEQRVMRFLKDSRKHGRPGPWMIEFLLPKEDLKPMILIQPAYTLQAIGAAIYADRIQGVEYRPCDSCGELIKIGVHSSKRYCDSSRPCKATAHKERQRENLRKAVAHLLDGLKRGLSKRIIDRTAKEQGIRLTPKAKEQAKLAARKQHKNK